MNDVKNIIAVETSSDICGISFISNGICLKTIQEKSERKHIEKIPLFYKSLQESIGFELSDVSAIPDNMRSGFLYNTLLIPTLTQSAGDPETA